MQLTKIQQLRVGLDLAEKVFGIGHWNIEVTHNHFLLCPDDAPFSDEDKAALTNAGWECDKELGWNLYMP